MTTVGSGGVPDEPLDLRIERLQARIVGAREGSADASQLQDLQQALMILLEARRVSDRDSRDRGPR
jgi:hypothetical protein